MNMIFIAFILIVISLLAILIYLLTANKKIEKKAVISESLTKIKLEDIQLPKNIEQMNSSALFQACKTIFDSYKALSYANNLPSSLDKIEWHSWQVSILISFLKWKNKFFVTNEDKIFHKVILDLNNTQIEQELQRIYRKYKENVNLEKNRDNLSKDVIWTARDVSIIFYRMIHPEDN